MGCRARVADSFTGRLHPDAMSASNTLPERRTRTVILGRVSRASPLQRALLFHVERPVPFKHESSSDSDTPDGLVAPTSPARSAVSGETTGPFQARKRLRQRGSPTDKQASSGSSSPAATTPRWSSDEAHALPELRPLRSRTPGSTPSRVAPCTADRPGQDRTYAGARLAPVLHRATPSCRHVRLPLSANDPTRAESLGGEVRPPPPELGPASGLH